MKKLPFFLFVLVIINFSCKNKAAAPDSFKQQLLGDWDWVNSTGGIDGSTRTPATDGRSKFIRFDSSGLCHSFVDAVEVDVMSFTIQPATDKKGDKESRTITFSKKDQAPNDKQGYSQHVMFKSKDTLILQDDCDDCFTNLYTRNTGKAQVKSDDERDSGHNKGKGEYSSYIPESLDNFLIDSMRDWQMSLPGQYDKYWWDQYKKGNSLVNFLTTDFNCDNKADYALVLLNHAGAAEVWVFLTNETGYKNMKLETAEIEEGPIAIGIDLLKKGKQGDMISNRTADIKCEGVSIVFFERAQHSYYWEKGKFKMIQTGD